MAKKTADRSPNEEYLELTNRSLSRGEGQSVIRTAFRGTEGRKFHVAASPPCQAQEGGGVIEGDTL
jgi:hypothetical protein